MNIFKKTVACLAATTVMTSMAVTASAEYKVSGVNGDDGKYYLRIVGLPEEISKDPKDPDEHPFGAVVVKFPTANSSPLVWLNINVLTKTGKGSCQVKMNDLSMGEELPCNMLTFEGFNNELGFLIEFESDNPFLEGLTLTDTLEVSCVAVGNLEYDSAGNVTAQNLEYFSSDGDPVARDFTETVTVTWEKVNETAPNEPNSEPTSSEPANEPTFSEPANEPSSSEPVSEPVSSEPTASQPSNVDTGTAGIAAVFGTAVLAAGAVIVTRKKK